MGGLKEACELARPERRMWMMNLETRIWVGVIGLIKRVAKAGVVTHNPTVTGYVIFPVLFVS